MPILEYQNGQVAYVPSAFQFPYPVRSLPARVGDAVSELSTIFRLPVELAAHAALGTISLVGQQFVNVQCSPYDPASVSLFLMAVSNSSGGKSIVEQRFLRAVVAFERRQEEATEAAMSDYRAGMKIWEDDGRRLASEYRDTERGSVKANHIRAQRRQHERDRPVEPQKWELRYADMSPAGLRDALIANRAVGILSPDAGPVLNGATFSQPAMLSGYWSGEDRPVGLASGNRRPVEPRLTISLMTQEDPFAAFMKSRGSNAFGTGLLGRFLIACPKIIESPGQSTQIEESPEPKLELFNQRVTDILNQTLPASRERLTLKLSEDAKRYWNEFKRWVHDELICGHLSDDMKSCFRRIGQQATRLAALFHYFDGAEGDISPDAMKGAIALCEWYAFEFIRMFTPYAPSQQQQDEEVAEKLLQWLKEAIAEPWRYPKLKPGRYAERDLRNYSSIRGNPLALERAINILNLRGYITVLDGPKGGRVVCYPAAQGYPYPGLPLQPIVSPSNGAVAMVAKSPIFPVQSMLSRKGAAEFDI